MYHRDVIQAKALQKKKKKYLSIDMKVKAQEEEERKENYVFFLLSSFSSRWTERKFIKENCASETEPDTQMKEKNIMKKVWNKRHTAKDKYWKCENEEWGKWEKFKLPLCVRVSTQLMGSLRN